MNQLTHVSKLGILLCVFAFACCTVHSSFSFASTPVLILTGLEYPGHKWQETTPALVAALIKDPRLAITIQQDPKFLASPQLHEYKTIVLHYMNWESPDPGPEARENLRKFVNNGGGLVLVHFACGAFQGWPEFGNIAGKVYDPKARPHDPRGPFRVEITPVDHPVTKGLASFDTDDELYTCLAGDIPVTVLATAKSKVDQKDYPIVFALSYGKGRVIHNVLGHDVKALSFPAVQQLYRRAAAWTAGIDPLATGN
jgi:type 1 glutamine amidotransferase